MPHRITRVCLGLLVAGALVASASDAQSRAVAGRQPAAGPAYTARERAALIRYSRASFAQKQKILGGLGFAASASLTSRASRDQLVGTWDTKPIPLAKIRSALNARGYTSAETNKMFKSLAFLYHIKKSIQYEISFYRDNGAPFQYVTFWDPTAPSNRADPAHGPYKLLSGSRVSYVGVTPPTDTYRTTFQYTVHGNTLILRYVSLVEPALSAAQRRADAKLPILQTVAPYSKVA